MKKQTFKFVTLLLFEIVFNVAFFKGFAQNGYLYTSEQLSSSCTTSIVQDRYGFIWIGTEYGLNRFDGYRFNQYFNQIGDNKSLISHDVITMLVSSKGELWLGCGKGLCRYNYSDNSFERFAFPYNVSPRVTHIIESPKGEIIFGTAGFGLFCIKNNKITSLIPPLRKVEKGFFSRIFMDAEGYLWHSGNMSLLIRTKIGGDRKNDVIYNMKYGLATSFIDYGKQGFIAVCTKGLMRYDYATHTFSDAGYDLTQMEGAIIERSKLSKEGNIYLGMRGNGLFVINKGEKVVKRVSINDKPVMESSIVNNILIDKSDNIWLSCYRSGLYEINRSKEPFGNWILEDENNPTGKNISAIAPLYGGGYIAVSYTGGIYHVSPFGHTLEVHDSPYGINSMIPDGEGEYWMSGVNTLWKYNPKSNKLTNKYTDKKYEFTHFGIDKKHLYISLVGHGFMMMDIKSEEKRVINSGDDSNTEGSLCNGWIMNFMTDSSGLIWISTADGVCCFNPAKNSFKTFGWRNIVPGTLCYGTVEDNYGRIIIASIRGLYCYDKKSNKIGRLPNTSELDNLHILGLNIDSHGDIWITSSQGLWYYNVETHKLVNHIKDNGLKKTEYEIDASVNIDGNDLAFGTDKGILFFKPDEVLNKKKDPGNVFLTAFTIGGKWQDIVNYEFTIPWDDNTFMFQLSTLSYDKTENVTYKYRINENSKWICAIDKGNTFSFNNIKPGNYIFEVKAVVNGVDTPVKYIKISIESPWYSSNVAFIIYALIVLALVYSFYIYYRRRLQSRYEEQKMRFLINATHDIRSPLTLIMGPLKKLRMMAVDEESKHYVDIIGRNADRMLTLVNQILDVRRLDENQMNIHCERTDLVTLVNGISTLFQFNARERGINITQSSNRQKIEAYVDRANFEKVITNLLSNALKYTFDGGNIEINLKAENKMVAIEVMDDGIGISKDDIPKLFDRFYLGNNSKGYNVGGTGIGLNLCRQLVTLHGGEISANLRSDGKRGSCFTISLPLGKKHLKPNQLNDNEDEINGLKGRYRASRNFKILVADDDIEVARYIKLELGEWYRVDIVSNGNDALNALFNGQYDLLITDVVMPVMDGVTLLKRIKGNPNISDIPVVLLTSKSAVEDRLDGLRYGADAYIAKPFNIDELHVTIDNLVDNVRRLRGKFSGNQSQEGKVENVEMKSNDDSLMQSIMNSINNNYTDPEFNVERLAADLAMSRVQLHRRMKEITGVSSSEFIRNIRLKQAARLIKEKQVNVSQVAYAVGFNSHAHFSTLFKKYYGMSPKDYADNGTE